MDAQPGHERRPVGDDVDPPSGRQGARGRGGNNTAELFDLGLGFIEDWRAVLGTVSTELPLHTMLSITGERFRGISEALGGGVQNSPTNYPLVQLRRLDNEQTKFVLPEPTPGFTDNDFTSVPLVSLQPGPALLTVFANGIPSVSHYILITARQLGSIAFGQFKCYRARRAPGAEKFERREVTLADQFETKETRVLKPVEICNPVDKNGEGILDETAHLTCFKIKDVRGQPRFQKREVLVENQFGSQPLKVKRARTLCVPSLNRSLQ